MESHSFKSVSPPSPSSVLPSSSRERKAFVSQLRQGVVSGNAEKIAQLHSIVDVLMPMPPSTNIDQFSNAIVPTTMLEKLECLLAGGLKLEDWAVQLRPYNVSPVCGLVWSTSYIGYRCKTCSRNPNMSLCADCFRAGNHEGHDSNMFRSSSGGTCDCGNASVMSPSGFCTFHGRQSTVKAPRDLVATAPYILFRALWRLTVFFRRCFVNIFQQRMSDRHGRGIEADLPEEMTLPLDVSASEPDLAKLCDWLESIANVGHSAKEEMVSALLDEDAYARMNVVADGELLTPAISKWACVEMISCFERTMALFSSSLMAEYYSEKGQCNCILDELFRWLLAFRLPTRLLNFLLSLLPVRSYASEMTKRLSYHYPTVSALLCLNMKVRSDHETERERGLAQRFLHVTVQLYSNADLAHLAVFECKGLSAQLASLIALFRYCSKHRRHNSRLPVVDTDNRILSHGIAYWPLVSDLYNLIVHRGIATYFLTEPSLIDKWVDAMSLSHAINLNQRYFRNHIEMDSETAFSTAYSLELEACSAPLWLIAAQIEQVQWSQPQRLYHAGQICRRLVKELEVHRPENADPTAVPCAFEFSFHLPLHRALSALLHAVFATYNPETIAKLLPQDEHFLTELVRPLLQLQGVRSEIGCNIWLRNGMLLRTKALAYAQTNFASSFIDLDLSLIQAAISAGLSTNRLAAFIFEQFHVLDSLSICQSFLMHEKGSSSENSSGVTSTYFGDQRYNEMLLIEAALTLLAQLSRLHLLPSMNIVADDSRAYYRHQLRREIVTQLCLADRTYSELVDFIPQRHIASVEMVSNDTATGTTVDDVDACIADVADFKEPWADATGQVQSGTYVLKDSVWLNGKDFDPTHVLLRAFQRKDFQTCMDRFVNVVSRSCSVASSTLSKQLWPPFCIDDKLFSPFSRPVAELTAKLCGKSRYLHAALFSLLFRYWNELSRNSTQLLPDQVIGTAVYLIELGVVSVGVVGSQSTSEKTLDQPATVDDLDFDKWYYSDDIFENLCQRIEYVRPPAAEFQQELRRHRLSELPRDPKEDSEWPGGGLNRATLQLSFSLPAAWRNAGKSDKVAVGHSLLSLLANIRNHFSQRSSPINCNFASGRVFDLVNYISMLLSKISDISANCKRHLNEIEAGFIAASKQMETTSEAGGDTVSEAASSSKATAAAAKRRERILALMAKQQRAFLEQMVTEGEVELAEGEPSTSATDSTSITAPASSILPKKPCVVPTYDCCICNLSGPSTLERPFVVVSMCQASKVLHHRYDKEGPFDLPVAFPSTGSPTVSEKSPEHLPATEHSFGHARQTLSTAFSDFWRTVKNVDGESDVSVADLPLTLPLTASSAFWPVDVHVTLCGSGSRQHAAHFDCHHNYLRVNRNAGDPLNNAIEQLFAMPGGPPDLIDEFENLGGVEMPPAFFEQTLALSARELGEFACPLCRQLANCSVPIIPNSLFSDKKRAVLPDPPAFDSAERLRQLCTFLDRSNNECALAMRHQLSNHSHVGLAMRQFQADISSVVQQSLLANSEVSTSLLRYSGVFGLTSLLASVVKSNFELSRLRHASAADECVCQALYPLVSCAAACSYSLLTNELRSVYHKIFARLTGLLEEASTADSLPILAYDPSTLFLLFMLSALPFGMSSAYASAIIQALFNLKVVQAILKVTRTFSPSERSSWKSKPSLVAHVISLGEQASLYATSDPTPIGISSSIISPQAFSDTVRAACFPFLEMAASFMCSLNQHEQQESSTCSFEFLRNKPFCSTSEKFSVLISSLGLDGGVTLVDASAKDVTPWNYAWFAIDEESQMCPTPSSTDSIVVSPPKILKMWFSELTTSASAQTLLCSVLTPMNQTWFPPKLLRVPNLFDQLFHAIRPVRCSQCHRVPSRLGICLICGQIVCFREVCCNRDGVFETVSHSRNCGAGTGLFLVVSTSCVFIIRGPRYTVWGSPYLDSHGEEDRDLKRGRPLHASTDRMAILERQWLAHGFDRVLRQWQWHSNRL